MTARRVWLVFHVTTRALQRVHFEAGCLREYQQASPGAAWATFLQAAGVAGADPADWLVVELEETGEAIEGVPQLRATGTRLAAAAVAQRGRRPRAKRRGTGAVS